MTDEIKPLQDWGTYFISKEIEFDAGHRVPNHKSKCRNPHGHRYRLRVTITGTLVTTPGASDEGMLADFGDLKTIMTEKVHDVLDHGFILYKNDRAMWNMFDMYEFEHGPADQRLTGYGNENNFKVIVVDFIPTAENLAKWCFDQLIDDVSKMGFQLSKIELWETPTGSAVYERR